MTQTIPTGGQMHNLSPIRDRQEYDDLPGLTQSRLKEFASCPETYWRRYVAKSLPPRERTDAMQFGCDVETWLETRRIDAVLIPDSVLSSSGSRAGTKWKDFEEAHRGQRLLKSKDYDQLMFALQAIDAQIEAHYEAAWFVLAGNWQQAKTWRCDRTDLECKCLCDLHDPHWIVDVKTAAEIEPSRWLRQAISLRYHWQAATYLETEPHDDFVFLAIQSTPPYRVECYEMDRELIDRGRREVVDYRRIFKRFSERDPQEPWRSTTHGSIYTIPTPPWALKADEAIYVD